MEKDIKVKEAENKELKQKIVKEKRKNLTKETSNTYLERISREKWINIYKKRIIWTAVSLLIIFYVVSCILANFISEFVIIASKGNFSFSFLWLVTPPVQVYMVILVVILTLLALPLTLLFYSNFLKKALKKTNWKDNEDSGTAHFLTDERNPWTIKPKMEAMYYPRTYFLDKGDWIIRLEKTSDYDTFLNQASTIFTFKSTHKDAKDLDDILLNLKTPIGHYKEEVKFTCANDVITDIKNISKGELTCSPEKFKSKVKAFLLSKKLSPVLIQTAGDSANAYVLGATGSGKTTKLNYPTIIANANAKQQPSLFISDPKGELYNVLSGYLTARGYEPYLLDLFDLIRSMGWNPLQDTYQKFVAKALLKMYLRQYEETRRYFATRYDEAKKYEDDDILEYHTPVIDERVNLEYPKLTYKEYKIIEERLKKLNINSTSEFVFDNDGVNNLFALENDYLKFVNVDKNDTKILAKYVCSVHTSAKAIERCVCESPNTKRYVLFDNYIFKSYDNLKTHFNSTLNTQINEQIRQVQNAIFATEKADHWIGSAAKVFAGVIYNLGYKVEDDINTIPIEKFNLFSVVVLTKNQEYFNEENFFYERMELSKIITRSKRNKKDENKYANALVKYRKMELDSRQDVINLNSIFNAGGEEGKSILSTFDTKMNPFLADGVKVLTSFNDITFEKLINAAKPKAVFVGINVNEPTYHPFITLFISNLHQKLSEKAKKSGGSLERFFMFMLDEFGNIPAIPNYGKILSTCRSENIKFMSIVQSNAQIEKNYDKDKDNIITNKGLNIYIKSNDVATAEYYSKVLGTTMIEAKENREGVKKGYVDEKIQYKSRSLMTPDEIYNLDYKYYNDTLFIANSKPILVQVLPWYKVFNTKDFTTYRPIQYKLNKYSIANNQFDYGSLEKDKDYIFNYYDITRKNLEKEAKKLEAELKNKVKIEEIENERALIKEEFNKEIETLQSTYGSIYDFCEILISTYDLKFDVYGGKSKEELEYELSSYNHLISKDLLFKNWILLKAFEFNFDKEVFIRIINDYLTGINSGFDISEEVINNKIYLYDRESINGMLLILSKMKLFEPELYKNLDVENNKDLSSIKDLILQNEKILDIILAFEISKYIEPSDNNIYIRLYDFLSTYKNWDNDNLTMLNKYFKATISEVDKYISNTTTITLKEIKEENVGSLSASFKYGSLSNKASINFLKEIYETSKEEVLLDEFWNNKLLEILEYYKGNLMMLVK